MNTFPSVEQLKAMDLNKLRNVDIRSDEEERIVQEIVDSKVSRQVIAHPTNLIVPDIKTKEEEIYWQAKIDAEKEKVKNRGLVAISEEAIEEVVLDTPIEDPNPFHHIEEKVETKTGKECCGSLGFRHKKNCPTLK